jgi:hypothetical protein
MQVDQNPFPVHALELLNPKVLIRPDQAEKAKGKNVIIGGERSTDSKKDMKVQSKMSANKIPKSALNASMPGGMIEKKTPVLREPI